jgi:hypothetical protein
MTAADRIRARITELQGIRERYLAYQQDRVSERDHHGAWDVAVNLSETECEISGLDFALEAMAAERCGEPLDNGCTCAEPKGHAGRHSCAMDHREGQL